MTSSTDELIERGLHAWAIGDLDRLEAVFHPAVTLRSVEPGEWDCVGRDELMWLLRQRYAQGNGALPVTIERVDEHTVIVASTTRIDVDGPQPFPIVTRITVAEGKVVAMWQYRTGEPGAGTE